MVSQPTTLRQSQISSQISVPLFFHLAPQISYLKYPTHTLSISNLLHNRFPTTLVVTSYNLPHPAIHPRLTLRFIPHRILTSIKSITIRPHQFIHEILNLHLSPHLILHLKVLKRLDTATSTPTTKSQWQITILMRLKIPMRSQK
jgi:hypothetical protein